MDVLQHAGEVLMGDSGSRPSKLGLLKSKAYACHDKIPLVRALPARATGIILLLVVVNLLVWAAVGIVLYFHPTLTGTAVLAYTFGLRHALDADHISAIDLMTRRLVADGQKPVTVGTFFSLGHSTIVIITSIVVAASAATISRKFDSFSVIGGIVGSSVSATFLIILGLANAYILFLLIRQIRRLLTMEPEARNDEAFKFDGGGVLLRLFKKLFRLIDRPWKMYPLGVLFGLGFDTSSEVALLGISSIQGTRGTSLWLILVLPVLFTAGMCLLDTADGALMLSLYTTPALARDPLTILYYNAVLTGVTVVVACVIGVVQLLGLAVGVVEDKDGGELKGRFWDGVKALQDHYDAVGGAICGLFVLAGLASIVCRKPWRRWVEGRAEARRKEKKEISGDAGELDGGLVGGGDEELQRLSVEDGVTYLHGHEMGEEAELEITGAPPRDNDTDYEAKTRTKVVETETSISQRHD